MDLFELSAKIELDDSGYKKSVEDAAQKAEDAAESIDKMADSAEEAEDSVDNLGDAADESEEAFNNSEDAVNLLSQSLKKLEEIAENTSKKQKKVTEETDKNKESFMEALLKTELFSRGLDLAKDAAKELAQYIWNLDEATKEYRVSQGKLNTAFKISGLGANNAKTAFTNLYRAVGDIDRATEASQLLSQLARDTQDVADWTTIATGVVGTFGDSLPIESLIESANETANVGKVVGTLADALNWAGNIGEDEFNAMLAECETQEERVDLITQTLMGTYQDAAGVFEDTSETVMAARDAYLEIMDAQSKVGDSVEDLKGKLAEATSLAATGFFSTVSKLIDAMSDSADSAGKAKASYRDYLDTMEEKISTGSIDEVNEALAELKERAKFLDTFRGKLFTIQSMGSEGGFSGWVEFFSQIGYAEDIDNLIDSANTKIAEAAENTDNLTESVDNLEDAVEPVLLTADGLSESIEYTGENAEEAAARLQTYADAATNMFSAISEESELSYADAVANLEANVQATQNFATNMESIASVLPASLAEMFYAGGPAMYAGTVAMLAEANAGADEGLKQLNAAYDAGGKEAIDLLLQSLGQVPEGMQDPAKIVAAQMDEDTSMETASAAVVERADTAMSEAVDSAGFAASGQAAMDDFISGLELKRQAVIDKAQSIASSAKGAIDNVLNNIPSGGRGSGRAGGLDIVPYNGYPAVLHAGEAVLTAREAKEWRSGNTDNSRQIVIHQHINTIPMTPAQLAAASEAYFEQAVWSL